MRASERRQIVSRRACIRLLGFSVAGGLLAACQQTAAPPEASKGQPQTSKPAEPAKPVAAAA